MNLRKVLIILLIPLLAELMVACCDCEEPYSNFYSHVLLNISNLDYSGAQLVISSDGRVPAAAYGIRLQIARQQNDQPLAMLSSPVFISRAHAISCDCPPPLEILPLDSITDIRIITLEDFDDAYPAMSDVSDLFRVFQHFNYLILDQFLEQTTWTLYYDQDYLLELNCLLMQPPTRKGHHRFRVQLLLSDGRILEQETNVELLP